MEADGVADGIRLVAPIAPGGAAGSVVRAACPADETLTPATNDAAEARTTSAVRATAVQAMRESNGCTGAIEGGGEEVDARGADEVDARGGTEADACAGEDVDARGGDARGGDAGGGEDRAGFANASGGVGTCGRLRARPTLAARSGGARSMLGAADGPRGPGEDAAGSRWMRRAWRCPSFEA